jgi:hypothetical protein
MRYDSLYAATACLDQSIQWYLHIDDIQPNIFGVGFPSRLQWGLRLNRPTLLILIT